MGLWELTPAEALVLTACGTILFIKGINLNETRIRLDMKLKLNTSDKVSKCLH